MVPVRYRPDAASGGGWSYGRDLVCRERGLIYRYTCSCKSLLNTLGRAAEQLAGCLASKQTQQSRSKYNSHANASAKLSYEYLIQ